MRKRRIVVKLTELNIVNQHSKYYILILVLSMANQERDEDWNKKRQQAQPFINKIRSCMEKKARWIEQIGFLRKCQKEGLVPKGLLFSSVLQLSLWRFQDVHMFFSLGLMMKPA